MLTPFFEAAGSTTVASVSLAEVVVRVTWLLCALKSASVLV